MLELRNTLPDKGGFGTDKRPKKAAILKKAIEYIHGLEDSSQRLKAENDQLREQLLQINLKSPPSMGIEGIVPFGRIDRAMLPKSRTLMMVCFCLH